MEKADLNKMQGPVTCVHIITRMDKGGSAENTYLTVKNLNRDKFKPVLIIGPTIESEMSAQERKTKYDELNRLTENGIKVMVCPHLYRRISIYHDLMAFLWLFTTIRNLKPEIVHTHTSKAGILGRWAAFFNQVPIICHTPHGHIFYGYFGLIKRTFFKWAERLTSSITQRIICLTEGEKEDHIQLKIAPEHLFFICPSGVDLDEMKRDFYQYISEEWQKELDVKKDDLVIGTMGRHVKVKGHEILLKASREILERKPNALFCFLGSGPQKEELEEKAKEWEISHRIRFIPWKEDPRPVLNLFKIFVFPSLNEGMGRSLVEAMALKKPVVATRTGGIPDLIDDGVNGLLVPPSDASALAEAILMLADRPNEMEKMGQMGEKMAQKYSLNVMMQKIEEMYQDLLETPLTLTKYINNF